MSCPPNSTGTNVSTGCSCLAGFSGNVTATTIAPAYYTGSCTLCSERFTSATMSACTNCTAISCTLGTCKAGYNTFAASSTPSCAANTCSCPNGIATVATGSEGTLCEINNAVDCSSCSSGYSLNATAGAGAQVCVANLCSCPNGTATVAAGNGGSLCEITGTVDCSTCNTGFVLNASAALGSQACIGLTTPPLLDGALYMASESYLASHLYVRVQPVARGPGAASATALLALVGSAGCRA